MDGKQLEGALKNWLAKDEPDASEDYKHDLYHEFAWEIDYSLKGPEVIQANVVTIELVDYQGGGEDVFPASGGEMYAVLKVDTDGYVQYFKRTGWYQSWDGSNWNDEWTEVFPTTETVTVFK